MPTKVSRKVDIDVADVKVAEATNTTPKKGRRAVKVEHIEAEVVAKVGRSTPKRSATQKVKYEDASDDEIIASSKSIVKVKQTNSNKKGAATANKKASAKRKLKEEDEDEEEEEELDKITVEKKVTKKRKTKEEKEAENMPLAERTLVATLKKAMHIGAHVSGAGGVHNAINNSLRVGGNSFALFLKSQRKWTNPPLAPEARDQFKAFCLEHKYDAARHIVPHCSYLVNLAQADDEKAKQAYDCFLDDLQRCEQLGIRLYNFHPGSTGGNPRPEAIGRIAAQLNKAHKATKTVITLLENMAGAGNVIGSTWEDLRDIIALIDDKSRVGVCLDTCHTFAAGYDLRSPEAFKQTIDGFSNIVGLSYLKALHINDSKTPLGSNRDLHANIGTGFLGLRAFHNVVNFEPFQHLPMVLETPSGIDDATEIKMLEGLIDADMETEEFKKEEQRLQDMGAEERNKHQGQVDKKKQKTLDAMFKKASPKKKKGKKSSDDEEESDDGGCSH